MPDWTRHLAIRRQLQTVSVHSIHLQIATNIEPMLVYKIIAVIGRIGRHCYFLLCTENSLFDNWFTKTSYWQLIALTKSFVFPPLPSVVMCNPLRILQIAVSSLIKPIEIHPPVALGAVLVLKIAVTALTVSTATPEVDGLVWLQGNSCTCSEFLHFWV